MLIPAIEHDPARGRFSTRVDDEEAELLYERRGNVLAVRHTFTPPALRGRELAARLTQAFFAYAREHFLKIDPIGCSYTRVYVVRHPELRDDVV
jgi:predicted GNAT family acetyltransferase